MKKIAVLFLLFSAFVISNSWAQLSAIDDVLVGRANNPNPSNSSGDRIYFNDLFNGTPITVATIGNFTMTETVPDPTGFTTLNTAFGFVGIVANTPPGLYYITYEICENANPTNCDTAVIEIRVFESTTSSGSGSFDLNVTSSAGSINCSGDVCITNGGCIDQATGTIPPITLSATYTEVGESNTYGVRSIPFNPPFSFGDTAGDTNLNVDDIWSSVLNFAFNFEFYQNDYTSCVLSTNGAVSFDLSNANTFHYWTPAAGATIPNNTDAALGDGNIFGAVHDIFPGAGGVDPNTYNITFGVKGTAPFRVFVFSFFNPPQYGCTTLRTSQMILFYESTNVIETYIFQKPVCSTWAGGRAAIGIQNDAGTQGIAPPGRNTGVWDVSIPEAWQFYPNGTPIYDFEWLDETGAVIGTDPTNLTVTPNTTTTYIAQLTYTDAITGDEYVAVRPITVVVQPTPVITLTSNNSVCSGGDAEFTITGSEGDVVDYNVNGGATQQVTLDATGVFVVTIPGITADQTLNLENVYNPNSGCNGALTQSETVTVNNSGSATFTLTPTCDGATATITGTSGGTFAFNPVPTDGAILDVDTGTITNGVPGTQYTLEYTITGACSATSTEDVTVLAADDASFTTTPTCDGGTVTITGTTGGTFAFNPVPPDGAVIDTTTGTVTGGASGATYTIEYTTMGSCPATSTQDVTALTTSDPSFTTTPTCDGGTVTITGDTGGTFAFNPAPTDTAVIDPATGEVTGGTSGATYTIEYTISGACGSSSTEDVTVLTTANPAFTTTDTCDGGTVTITGDTGGVFAFNPVPTDGAVIDTTSGTVTSGVPGTTYTIEYTISGSCGASSTQDITVLPNDDASFTTTPTCDGGTVTITGTAGGTFAFNPVPTDGAVIDTATGTVTLGTSGVTYTIEYTTTGVCPASSTQDVTVLTTANPAFTTSPTCDGGTVTITGDTGGAFAFNPVPTDMAVIDPVTGEITNGTSGATYTIEYTISGSCGASSTEDVTVYSQEDPAFTVLENCNGGTMTIVGDTGGTFAFNPVPTDGATIDSNTGEVTGGTPSMTYTVQYTTGGPCPESSFQNVTVLPADDASFTTTPTCDGGTVTIIGNVGGSFAFNPVPTDGALIDVASGEVTNGTSGTTYTIEYTTVGACPATSTEDVTVITIDDASFTVSPTCDGGIATVTGLPGGSFAFNPVPTDGAVIDTVTGEVTGGTPGASYTIEYTTNGTCPNTSTAALNVHPLPTVVNPTSLVVCDDATPDGMVEMDLTVKNDEISGNNSNYSVTYHNSLVAAQMGTPEVMPSDTAYVGTDGETLYVRVEDNTTGCYDTTTLTLEVTNGPTVATPTPLRECDVDNDGLATFDLTSARDEILAVDPTLEVSFHLTQQNALDNVNPQGDTLSNVAGQIIYIRVSFGTGADCPTVVELMLIVEPSPDVPSNIDPYALCDDDDDGIVSFNLNTMNDTIFGTQNPADFTLTYHETLADAEAVPAMNPIVEPQLSDYVSGNTTIYVRLEGNNGCVTVGQFDLVVNPLPVIPADAQDSIYEICDDSNDNDGFATFDLTTQNDDLTGGNASLVVDYYETMMDIPNNPISDYTAYDNTSVGGLPHNPQTLFVTVTETTSGSSCYALTTLTLVVNTLPTPNDVLPDLIECDDNDPGNLQEEFDLTQNEGLMLNDFDESVTYYESFADAESGDNEIATPTNYTNISTPQTIYVRVTNTGDPGDPNDDGTGCYTIITFDLIVNPLPVFIPDDQYVICINTNGTEVVGPPTIDTGLNPSEYTFEWVDPNGTIVSIDSVYTATQSGTYTVEITNIATGCFNIIPVVVEESSPPVVSAEVVTEAFADNNVISVTATGEASAIFEFSIDNGPWVSNEPNDNTYTFTNVLYGEHEIQVRDINGCGIASDTVFVIDYPLFFTPNNDGDNDLWQISGINPDAVINIFDRYGKLLKQLSPNSPGWDGTLNGYPLPTSDYWFTVVYKESPDDEAMKEFKAHFTLKR
ncbi:T9SS type B sorting domain-containing protein [Hanstruepera marina]|uniref:T9SS type B sorting domain-containing protein n=1 Tax=Hanstruepera marina TaxID=2873265 RepID=UPI001CA7A935|nr:T9SS type B sorting domain-containing protein [Hanstruepera marina]